MGRYSRHLKIVLLIAIILTITTVFLSVSSSLQSLKRYKENLVDFSEFVMRSFESGNRAFMMNEQFSRRTIEQFAQDISKQKIIEDIIVYSASGEVVLSVGDRKTSSYQGLLARRSDNIEMVELDDSFFLFKRFNPFAGMPMGRMGGRMGGHMMGEGMMHMWDNNNGSSGDYYIGILLNKSEYSAILQKSIVDVSQVIILGILLMIIFFYSVRIIGEYERNSRKLQLAEREAEIGKFANVLAHEIKNPLSSMKGLINYSARKIESPEISGYLFQSIEEIDRLNKIVNDFLSFGSDMALEFQKLDLEKLVNHIIELLEYDIKAKGLTVHVEGSSFEIYADKDKLMQAVMNLIINAVQGAPDNSDIYIKLDKKAKRADIKNEVKSKPQVNSEKLFEPFYTEKSKGTGLGMAVAKKILMLHQGGVNVINTDPFVVKMDFSGQNEKDFKDG